MIGHFGPLPMRWFAATRHKVLWVKYESRGIFLKFINNESVYCKVTDDTPVVVDTP
jgi:hypothetical protein